MSSMDQVFVKAFSRRRLAESDGQPGSHAAHSDASPTATTPAQPAIDPDRPSGEIGSLQVDRSVAETAEVWVDGESGKDVIARADHASLEIPRPHVELPSESQADPSQHVHTAYAGAFADPSLIAASLPQEESFAQIGSWPDADDTDTRRDSSEASSESTLTETSDLFAEEPVVEMRIDPPVPASSPKQVPTPDVVATPDEVEDTQPVSASELNLPQTMTSEEAANESGATYVPFQAVWEVDVFDVPTPVADLFFEGALFQQIAERMSDAVSSGLRSVLVTSAKTRRGTQQCCDRNGHGSRCFWDSGRLGRRRQRIAFVGRRTTARASIRMGRRHSSWIADQGDRRASRRRWCHLDPPDAAGCSPRRDRLRDGPVDRFADQQF